MEELRKCPFCGSDVHMIQCNFPFYDYGTILIGCLHCEAALQEHVSHRIDDDCMNLYSSLWNDSVERMLGEGGYDLTKYPDVALFDPSKDYTEKEQERYKVFLSDREKYESEHGEPMPIWHGICPDYMHEVYFKDAEERKKEMEENGKTKEEIYFFINEKLKDYSKMNYAKVLK